MGRGILIVVLGAAIVISVLLLNLNANTTNGLNSTLSYYDKTQARLIANSGIEIYLEKLRRNKYLSGSFPNNSLMGGNYSIDISGPDTNLEIVSIGTYNEVTHKCVVTAKRKPIVLPGINSSIYVSSNSSNFHLSGNMNISGYDHFIDGDSGGSGTPLPGMGVTNGSDSTNIVNNIKPNINGSITGAGGSPSVNVVTDTTNWETLTKDYIFASDITLPSGTYSSDLTLGTKENPKITYVNGDVHFSDASGYGIMVVNGNFSMSGNFTFRGIVIVYGNSTITTKSTGNSGIIGASIFVGQSVDFNAAGNAQFLYSKQAIDNAEVNLKSSQFVITSWWE